MNLATLHRKAAAIAREIRLLNPYLIGRCLRRWHVRKLVAHYETSAKIETYFAEDHAATAKRFSEAADAARAELAALETSTKG